MATELSRWQAWGETIGAVAWPGFVLALLLWVALWSGLAMPASRAVRPSSLGPAHSRTAARTMLHALSGVLVVLLALLFLLIAASLGPDLALVQLDDGLSEAVGAYTPQSVLHAFSKLTKIGDPWPMVAWCTVIALLLWGAGQRSLAVGWVFATGGNALLNRMLKLVFERERPEHDSALAQVHGFSFPSGHSSSALVAWGMLAYLALRLLPARWHMPAWALASAMVFSIAASRVMLQVHYLSDVLAGLCSGGAWLTLCVATLESLRLRGPSPTNTERMPRR